MVELINTSTIIKTSYICSEYACPLTWQSVTSTEPQLHIFASLDINIMYLWHINFLFQFQRQKMLKDKKGIQSLNN